jgi:hypothetical protein
MIKTINPGQMLRVLLLQLFSTFLFSSNAPQRHLVEFLNLARLLLKWFVVIPRLFNPIEREPK